MYVFNKRKNKVVFYIDVGLSRFTRGSHLSEEQQEERCGVHLKVPPLVVPHHRGTRPGVVLGMERVRRAPAVFELLHFVQLRGNVTRGKRMERYYCSAMRKL